MSVAASHPGFGSTQSIPFTSNLTLSFVADSTEFYILNGYGHSSLASLQMFYLTITKNNVTVLSKHVDMLRSLSNGIKLIYLNATKNIDIDLTSGSFTLNSMTTDPANFKLDTTITPSSTSGTVQTFNGLAAGYYTLRLSVSSAGTLSYQSDPYPCPYDSAVYSDYYRAF